MKQSTLAAPRSCRLESRKKECGNYLPFCANAMPKYGRKPDVGRRLLATSLREQGLSYGRIAHRLGVTRQCVLRLIQANARSAGLPGVQCNSCGAKLTASRVCLAGPAFCLACLAKHSKATFGQRLRSLRVAAGMTQTMLATRSGLTKNVICYCEQLGGKPRPRVLLRLEGALGRRLWYVPSEA
jgi:DNA-binding XRE family transcriptional regulator